MPKRLVASYGGWHNADGIQIRMGIDMSDVFHGCFFCRSGQEKDVVQRFEMALPEGKAMFPTRSRIRRKGDIATEDIVPLLPGYVFFEVTHDDVEDELSRLLRTDSILRLLRYSDGRWQLMSSDEQFAALLFETGGHIGISQVFFDEGKKIRIISGFLKNYEGSINRINKKTRTVEVQIDLQGKKTFLWLGYELVEPIQ